MRTTGNLWWSLLVAGVLAPGLAAAVPAADAAQCCANVVRSDRSDPGQYFFTLGETEFRRGHHETAAQRFRLAAHWGYKTAQYNLGLMYFKGVGVGVDRPAGMAWLALAAERSDPPFVAAREWAYAQLTAPEFARANEIWRSLKHVFGDQHALARANQRFRRTQLETTGSHLGGFAGSAVFELTRIGEVDRSRAIETGRQQKTPYGSLVYPRVDIGDLVPLEAKPQSSPDAAAVPSTD